ncbi:MAG TPA: M23 family metallopeptidase [Pyrinomonadaceae bacterium]
MEQVEVLILPKTLHVEVVERAGESHERYFFHLIFRNRAGGTVTAEQIVLTLKNEAGDARLLHTFEGDSLRRLFEKSQPFIEDGEGTLEIPPGRARGIVEYRLEGDGASGFTEAECLFSGRDAEGQSVRGRRRRGLSRRGALTRLLLPLRGRWWVAGGHFGLEPHSRSHLPSLAYAYDFIQLGDGGKSYRNDGLANEDYYAYGQPVFASAEGRVVTAVGGVAENLPSRTPRRNPEDYSPTADTPMLGNHVVIVHEGGEHTFYAHLQPSLSARAGERVATGQVIGKVGNSGESTEPHLHFHLADGPSVSNAEGIPVAFDGWKEDAFGIMSAPAGHATVLSREMIESLD